MVLQRHDLHGAGLCRPADGFARGTGRDGVDDVPADQNPWPDKRHLLVARGRTRPQPVGQRQRIAAVHPGADAHHLACRWRYRRTLDPHHHVDRRSTRHGLYLGIVHLIHHEQPRQRAANQAAMAGAQVPAGRRHDLLRARFCDLSRDDGDHPGIVVHHCRGDSARARVCRSWRGGCGALFDRCGQGRARRGRWLVEGTDQFV